MAEHRVTWQIDVDASTALEAARKARWLQVLPFTTARVFDVVRTGMTSGSAERVDLGELPPEGPDPSDVLLDIAQTFPGLVDGATDVSGADLVQFLTNRLHELAQLDDFLAVVPQRIDTK